VRQAYTALRFFILMGGGVVLALTTGNPLYLGITALAFIALAVYVWRQGYVYEPKWEPLFSQGVDQGNKADWTQAITSFQTALKKCRGNAERRQASEQIGTFLLRNDRIGDAEPYVRQAVNLSTAALGPTHAKTIALRDRLSDLYMKTGQPALAAQLHGRAMASATARDLSTVGGADAEVRYAEILQQAGDPTAAAALYQKALQTIEAAKTDSPALIPALLSAARYASGTGDRKRAEELLRRASRCMNKDTPGRVVDNVLSTLVEVLAAEERYADAVRVLQERLRGPSREPAHNARLRRQLADLMDKANMPEEAAKQRRVAQTLEAMVRSSQSVPTDA